MLNGFLNVYKPVGMSSHQVVQEIRRITHHNQVGHAGTLDPMAEGVLPVAVGSYTRLLEWANLKPKAYQAHIAFGEQTHSGDQAGYIIGESGAPYPNSAEICRAIAWLEGTLLQFPPQVSALKQNGRRAYDVVRRGQNTWLAPRATVIHSIRLTAGEERSWSIELTVGPGTYIRAIARDLGFLLGHATTMQSLVRTRVGAFRLEDARRLEDFRRRDPWEKFLLRNTSTLTIPVAPVTACTVRELIHGKTSAIPSFKGFHGIMGLTYGGEIVAVIEGPPWRLRKVLAHDVD